MDGFVKITEDMVYDEDKESLPLCDWVRIIYNGECADYRFSMGSALVDCESPIEQALSMEIERLGIIYSHLFTNGRIDIVCIDKQFEVTANGKTYRADFHIPVIYRYDDRTDHRTFIVECDGHDYHEKTKEQVAKNNKRERDLKSAGYDVIRFSGSEIYRSSWGCAIDLLKIITKQYSK